MNERRNHSFREIAEQLRKAESILIYPHVNMDGDALGSAAAMCRALRQMGKSCYILIEDSIPRNLQFLDRGYCTSDQNKIQAPDLSFCLDCGDTSRFLKRKDKFAQGKVSVCIDHHQTTKPFCDYNYIDPQAAATGELIFRLLEEMEYEGDAETGEALFAAITTDTGNFQYSNTTKESHLIMARLYDWGIDTRRVSTEIYENVRLEKLLIESRAMETLELLCGGQAAIAYADQKMLNEVGASMDETEGIVDQLRSIEGVEIAAFIKEQEPEKIRVSFRAKSWGNVMELAKKLGGGGHMKAAGCTLSLPLEAALAVIRQEIAANLRKSSEAGEA